MKDFESTIHSVAADLDDEPNGVNDAPKPGYWRSLEELAETPDFAERMQREFPRQAAELGNLDRRRFLQLSGASLGLAGLTACTKQPPEKIVPYVRQPEDIVPGKPLFFATAIPRQGFAMPVLAESHMGRPTKVDGNCEHPASKGGSDTITQASIFNLYDPDRSQAILHLGQIRTWDAFVAQLDGIRSALGAVQGEGLAIVTGSVTSPTLQRLMADLFAEMPKARHIVDEPGDESQMIEGVRQATGTPGVPIVDFTAADVVVSIDADFLSDGPSAVSYAADFATRRNARSLEDAKTMSRLYAVDSMPNGTSTSADHRLALQPSEVSRFVLALAAQLGVQGAAKPDGLDERTTAWVEEVAADLEAHRGASAVVVGAPLAPEVHAVAMAINTALGNIGSTIEVLPPQALAGEDLSDLVASIERDEVTTLLVLGANPVYTSPGDLDVAAAMDKVPLRIHLGTYIDETGERCHWHVPESHALESWGDLKGFDGTAALVQPIIQTLYDSHTAIDVVAALLGQSSISAEGHVSATWRQRHAGPDAGEFSAVDFKKAWRRALHDGMVVGTRATALDVSVDATAAVATLAEASGSDIELIFRLDPTVLDGRYANNGWLQEAPKPITLLTWDNALLMSPRTARENGFGQRIKGNEQLPKTPVGRLVVGETTVEAPVWAVPGMADGTVLLHLGYGRRKAGHVAMGTGVDAAPVRSVDGAWTVTDGVSLATTEEHAFLACTQDHHSMEGRAPIQEINIQTYEAHPDDPLGIHFDFDVNKSMMPGDDFSYERNRWGMTVDLTSCTGCNACLMACNAENNIPVVGKDQVIKGREMHWMRIDRYYRGDDPNNVEQIVHQPVSCMQCEQAPCEVVCPVAATVHSDEGLNDMVYNRCVGTRYCSNNCPYKVRRFNFLLYQDFDTPQYKMMRNPDVTVRSRGVMEKCTYCVQKINGARIEARRKGEEIPRDSITVACQGACPSGCIEFGDLADPESRVSKAKASPLDYTLLAELGNRPRTTYLGRVTNPNPQLWARLHPDRPLVPERPHRASHGHGHGDDHGGDAHHGAGDDHGAAAAHGGADHGTTTDDHAAEAGH